MYSTCKMWFVRELHFCHCPTNTVPNRQDVLWLVNYNKTVCSFKCKNHLSPSAGLSYLQEVPLGHHWPCASALFFIVSILLFLRHNRSTVPQMPSWITMRELHSIFSSFHSHQICIVPQ